MDYFLAVLGVAVLVFLAWRGLPIWSDAGRRGWGMGRRAGWALWGALQPGRYWWRTRIEGMAPEEQAVLLARETEAMGLSQADSQRCPLCGAEVPQAWRLTRKGEPAVGPEPVNCPECDFRLDTCRHCTHFMPGAPQSWAAMGISSSGPASGRCGFYKKMQPVEQVAGPDMAHQLKERGYDQIRGPMQITDSYLRPDFCRAFEPDRKRMRASGVRWPDERRAALLRLSGLAPAEEAGRQKPAEDEDPWLL